MERKPPSAMDVAYLDSFVDGALMLALLRYHVGKFDPDTADEKTEDKMDISSYSTFMKRSA